MRTTDWVLAPSYSDEFNEATLDTTKWVTDPHSWGTWGWRTANVSVAGGDLRLRIAYEPHRRGRKEIYYTSGIVVNKAPLIRYGYFEARIKGSRPNPGTHPVFWLTSVIRGVARDTAMWTEIDVLEAGRHPNPNHLDHIVHVFKHPLAPTLPGRPGEGWAINVGGTDACWNPSNGYHVYGVEWTPRAIRMYVDGELQGTIRNLWWHQPLLVVLSLSGSKQIAAHPTPNGYPGMMSVDYVRVWTSESVQALSPLTPSGSVMTKRAWRRGLALQSRAHACP